VIGLGLRALEAGKCNDFIISVRYILHTFNLLKPNDIYRVSQDECEILRESVPYVKLYRYNPKTYIQS